MKTNEEFKAEIYQRRDRKLAVRKKVKHSAFLCVPLAVLLVLGSIFLPKMRPGSGFSYSETADQNVSSAAAIAESRDIVPETAGETAQTARIPLLLQVARPSTPRTANLRDLQKASRYAALQKDSSLEQETAWGESEEELKTLSETALIEADFSQALNDFSRDIITELQGQFEENACLSSLSLYYALALSGSGAGGITAQEFQSLLHDKGDGWAERQCGNYYRQHYHRSEESSFLLANSLWLDGRYAFDGDFISGAEENFYSSLFQVDFSDPSLGEEAAAWISDNTEGLLKPEINFSKDERLAILNTVNYRAQWITPFFPEYNTSGSFHKSDGSTVTAEFMNTEIANGSIYEGNGFLRASLPMQNGSEMIFILPEEGVDPHGLISDPTAFEDMFFPKAEEEFTECKVSWSVPKFSFDCEYDLKDTLRKLGLETALDRERADFSGMDGGENEDNIYLSRSRQSIHVCIDENGIGAATYTLVAMQSDGINAPSDKTVEMVLDRPFLFAVVNQDTTLESDKNAGSLIFVGICGVPTAVEE